MKTLSRESIKRMWPGAGGNGAGGGGGDLDLTGYASQLWVNQNYVSIDFFKRLFTAWGPAETSGDPDVEVEPNDLNSTITNIKAMVGTWTEEYLSALGMSSTGGGGGATALYDLLDVKQNAAGDGVYGAATGKVLTYGSDGKWYAADATAGSVTNIGMTFPTGFTVSPSSITSQGVFSVSFGGSITKNYVLASPSNAAGAPSWRALVAADRPDLSGTYATSNRVTTLENYFDASGNAKSALKLTTVSKTAWGQTYWTSGGVPTSIDGNMTNVGDISFSSSGKKIGGFLTFDTTNTRLGVNTTSPSYLLHVDGYAYTTRLYLASGVYFEYKSGDAGVKLVGAGLYTDSYITALGLGSSGSGSTTALNDLTDVTISSAANGNVLAYNGTKWVNSSALSVTSVTANGNISAAQKLTASSASVGTYMAIGQSTVDTNYNLYINGNERVNDLVLGNTTTVNNVSCETIQTLSSHGIYIKTGASPNYVDGTWTNASDIRLKDVVSDAEASIEDIANAPIFNYKWKNGDGTVMLGTKAQHWVNVFPTAVPEGPGGYLFIDPASIALASAVMVARKVQNHEEKIAQLDNRVEEVEKENLLLKDIINHLKGIES